MNEEMNRIELAFEEGDTCLAGYPYGEKIFKDQVDGKLDRQQVNMIIFPDQIEQVAISFTQGFFKGILEEEDKQPKIKSDNPDEEDMFIVILKAKDKELTNKIINDLKNMENP